MYRFVLIVQCRQNLVRAIIRGLSRQETIQCRDLCRRQYFSERDRLFKRSHEEDAAAFAPQSRCDVYDTKSIGVGFHDGSAGRGRRSVSQKPVIGCNRVQIDGQKTGQDLLFVNHL